MQIAKGWLKDLQRDWREDVCFGRVDRPVMDHGSEDFIFVLVKG